MTYQEIIAAIAAKDGEHGLPCPHCGEIGGVPEIVRGEGWSEEYCSNCVRVSA